MPRRKPPKHIPGTLVQYCASRTTGYRNDRFKTKVWDETLGLVLAVVSLPAHHANDLRILVLWSTSPLTQHTGLSMHMPGNLRRV